MVLVDALVGLESCSLDEVLAAYVGGVDVAESDGFGVPLLAEVRGGALQHLGQRAICDGAVAATQVDGQADCEKEDPRCHVAGRGEVFEVRHAGEAVAQEPIWTTWPPIGGRRRRIWACATSSYGLGWLRPRPPAVRGLGLVQVNCWSASLWSRVASTQAMSTGIPVNR